MIDASGLDYGRVDHPGTGLGTGLGADLTGAAARRAQLVAALERQEAALAVVHTRLRAATSGGVGGELDWSGTARRLYDIGLAALLSSLAVAVPSVDEALSETRRAISTLTVGG